MNMMSACCLFSSNKPTEKKDATINQIGVALMHLINAGRRKQNIFQLVGHISWSVQNAHFVATSNWFLLNGLNHHIDVRICVAHS